MKLAKHSEHAVILALLAQTLQRSREQLRAKKPVTVEAVALSPETAPVDPVPNETDRLISVEEVEIQAREREMRKLGHDVDMIIGGRADGIDYAMLDALEAEFANSEA